MTSGVVLYILASFSLTSVLGIVALPGCNTSTIYKQNNDRIISVQNKLITGKKILICSPRAYKGMLIICNDNL